MPAVITKRKDKTIATKLCVDYPRQDEIIAYPQYTFRVNAPEQATSLEVAVNQGDWRPCRKSAGFWWHDWSGYADGEHEIIARAKAQDGRLLTSEPREFFVKLQPKNA